MRHGPEATVEMRSGKMNGYQERLTPKQEQGVLALLREATAEDAAKAVGVSKVTLWRWSRQPEFQARVRQARRQVAEAALGELQQVTIEAVRALRRNLTSGVPSVEVRAALGVLDRVSKATDVLDQEARVTRLERQLGHLDRQLFDQRLEDSSMRGQPDVS